ncbi:MAG: hypothetical protein ACI84R_004079, partial [Candidatus Azotimanducaceae bacterium]
HRIEVSNHLGADIGKQVHQFRPKSGRMRCNRYMAYVNGRWAVSRSAKDAFIFQQGITIRHA